MAHLSEIESVSANWNRYSIWNRRHEGLAEVWVRDLIHWLKSQPMVNGQSAVLDFGCGYFDVGLALVSHVSRIDGFDVSPEACAIAAQRAAAHPNQSKIFNNAKNISLQYYDLIIVNSVIQYLPDLDSLRDHFFLWKSLLKDRSSSQIVIADIIPTDYVAWRDALRSLEVSRQEKMLGPMVAHLWKAATKPRDLGLLQVDFEVIRKLADTAGLKVNLLPVNLTPSRQRYSVIVSMG